MSEFQPILAQNLPLPEYNFKKIENKLGGRLLHTLGYIGYKVDQLV